jgi:hypothetical protein
MRGEQGVCELCDGAETQGLFSSFFSSSDEQAEVTNIKQDAVIIRRNIFIRSSDLFLQNVFAVKVTIVQTQVYFLHQLNF